MAHRAEERDRTVEWRGDRTVEWRGDGRGERLTVVPVCNYRIGHPDIGRKRRIRNTEEDNKINKNEGKNEKRVR
jgi:hypothetical protein